MMGAVSINEAVRCLKSCQDSSLLSNKFKACCEKAVSAMYQLENLTNPTMLTLDELLAIHEEPVYIWFFDAPGRWVIRSQNAWTDSCTPERMSLFNMKWYLHSRYGSDWKAFRNKPQSISAEKPAQTCNNCRAYAELKEPFRRTDGATIYGYCFADADHDYSPSLGKGYPVYINGGGCSCKKYKQKA